MDALHELSEDFLTCSICLDRYTNPKQLPCLHSFCRDCLSDHIKANDIGGLIAFPCPECRKTISPASSTAQNPADEFPDNFYIAGMVSAMVQRGVSGERQDSKKDGDECPNHSNVTCDDFCTKANVGVCTACQVHHRTCKQQHIPVHQAKNKVFAQVSTLKLKLTSLLKNAETVHESLVDIPSNIRLRKEELLSDISQHFADIKTTITKGLIEKEKEMITKLKEVLIEEENWAGEALDENKAITQHCTKDMEFLDEQITKRSLNASAKLHSMQGVVEKFGTDLSRLECESDVKKIEYVPENVDNLISNLVFGDIRSPHTTVEGAEIPVDDSDVASACNPAPTFEVRPSQPLMPSAPILLDEHGMPTWDLSRYSTSNQSWPAPVSLPSTVVNTSNHAYPGMVIRIKGPRTSTVETMKHRQKEADRLYMERLNRGKHIELANVKKLLPTAELRCRDRQDTRQCKFVGITAVAEDAFLLTDRWNRNLKLVKLKGPVVKAFPLKNQEPWDATRVLTSKRNEIAITFPSICSIVFVEYEDAGQGTKLDIKKEVRTAVGYGSLGCINHEELVCGVCNPFGSPRIDIVSMQGRILRKIEDLVAYPRSIDTSPGHVIAVSDWTQRKVILLQENGQIIKTIKGPGNLQPKGVAYYEDGCFLVVDQTTGCLHKVSEEGKFQMTFKVVNESSIVACVPTSRNFCKGLAIVIASNDGLVRVYDAEQVG